MKLRCRICGDADHIFGGGAVPAGGESGVASEVMLCYNERATAREREREREQMVSAPTSLTV